MRNDTLHKKGYFRLYKIFGFFWLSPVFANKKLAKGTKICSQIWQGKRLSFHRSCDEKIWRYYSVLEQ
jgi:hypothetical protein